MIGNFGVTSTGFIPKRISDITAQLQAALTADFGASFSLLSQTPDGQLVNRFSEQTADVWEGLEMVYNSFYPATAAGPSLDASESMVNIPRIPATASVANGVVFTGTSGTVIPNTAQVSVSGQPGSIFQVYQSVTIGAGGTVTGTLVCTSTGPTQAAAGTLTQSISLPAGVTCTNPTAAQAGTNAETDSAYRVRAANELGAAGSGTFNGLLQSLQAVLNVSAVYLFSNDTDATVNGLLPHSILAIVVGGADQDIYNAIFAAKPAGINTNGSQTGTVVDSQQVSHSVSFSRLVDVPIYMDVTIVRNTNPSGGNPVFPANGLSLVQSAIIAYGSDFLPGETVVVTGFYTPINTVPGVLSATIKVSLAYPATSSSNLTMSPAQLAQFLPGVDGSSNTYINVHE